MRLFAAILLACAVVGAPALAAGPAAHRTLHRQAALHHTGHGAVKHAALRHHTSRHSTAAG